MTKRLMVGLLAGGLLAATASPALAGPPSMGCPDGFEDTGITAGHDPDRNENGKVCAKPIERGSPPVGLPPILSLIILTDDHPIGPPLG